MISPSAAVPRSTVGIACIVLFISASPAQAQRVSVIQQDARIRVKLENRQMISGLASPSSANSIAIRDQQNVVHTLSAASIMRLEEFAGRRSRVGRGALIGLGIGAIAGAVLGAQTGDTCSLDPFADCTKGESALGGAMIFGILGAGAGAGLGAIRRDVWVLRPRPWRVEPQGAR